jgi:hypothetical protein
LLCLKPVACSAVAQFLFRKFKEQTLLPRVSLEAVTPPAFSAHKCRSNPWGCLSHQHDVILTDCQECWNPKGATGRFYSIGKVDLMIIRHGPKTSGILPPASVWKPADELERKRHSIPYHLIG